MSAERIQLNVRVDKGYRQRNTLIKALTGFSVDQLVEDALASFYDIASPDAVARRKRVQDHVNRLRKGKIPFDKTWPSLKSNALTSRGDSANFVAPEQDGVVAQLVEHHNGMVLGTSKSRGPGGKSGNESSSMRKIGSGCSGHSRTE